MSEFRSIKVKRHVRQRSLVREHARIMTIKGSSQFKGMVNDVSARDKQIRESPLLVNVREVDKMMNVFPGKISGGRTISFPNENKLGSKKFRGFDVFIDKDLPRKDLAFLHELGHISDESKLGFGRSTEEGADRFAVLKAKQLGFGLPNKSEIIQQQELGFLRRQQSGKVPIHKLQRTGLGRIFTEFSDNDYKMGS